MVEPGTPTYEGLAFIVLYCKLLQLFLLFCFFCKRKSSSNHEATSDHGNSGTALPYLWQPKLSLEIPASNTWKVLCRDYSSQFCGPYGWCFHQQRVIGVQTCNTISLPCPYLLHPPEEVPFPRDFALLGII